MGGLTFTRPGENGDPALSVPRIPPVQYLKLRDECITKLQHHFHIVVSPHAVPGKPDHGDIDLLVSDPIDSDHPPNLAKELEAARAEYQGASTNLAIPRPDLPDGYYQLDVERCVSRLVQWEHFMKSYGDMTQILGIMQRHLGLTANNRGFFIRIPEIEPHNWKESLILLSEDPHVYLKFLGLDHVMYDAGFATENDIFDWCASARIMGLAFLEDRREKSNDRQRQRKRVMYQRFMEEWVPAHLEDLQNRPHVSREDLFKEALDTFDIYEEYKAKIAAHRFNELIKHIRACVADTLRQRSPEQRVSASTSKKGVKSLVRWVVFDAEGQPRIRTVEEQEALPRHLDLSVWAKSVSIEKEDDFLEWINTNLSSVLAMETTKEQRRQQRRSETLLTTSNAGGDARSGAVSKVEEEEAEDLVR